MTDQNPGDEVTEPIGEPAAEQAEHVEEPIEEPPAAPAKAPSSFHPVNVGHLVMGTAFVGLMVVWALISSDTVKLVDAHWLLPLPWLVAGVVGLVATVLRSAGRRAGKMSGWT
jgi:uncharacterized membrane protein